MYFTVVEEEIAPTEKEEESEDSEKFEPPLQYKHFARFLAILRSYYSLCKVELVEELTFRRLNGYIDNCSGFQ